MTSTENSELRMKVKELEYKLENAELKAKISELETKILELTGKKVSKEKSKKPGMDPEALKELRRQQGLRLAAANKEKKKAKNASESGSDAEPGHQETEHEN